MGNAFGRSKAANTNITTNATNNRHTRCTAVTIGFSPLGQQEIIPVDAKGKRKASELSDGSDSEVIVKTRALKRLVTSANEAAASDLSCDMCGPLISQNVTMRTNIADAMSTSEGMPLSFTVFGYLEEGLVEPAIHRILQRDFICNPSWTPFKNDGSYIINQDNEILHNLRILYGDKVVRKIIVAKKEILEHNPSGNYPVSKPCLPNGTLMNVADLCRFYAARIVSQNSTITSLQLDLEKKAAVLDTQNEELRLKSEELKQMSHTIKSLKGRLHKMDTKGNAVLSAGAARAEPQINFVVHGNNSSNSYHGIVTSAEKAS